MESRSSSPHSPSPLRFRSTAETTAPIRDRDARVAMRGTRSPGARSTELVEGNVSKPSREVSKRTGRSILDENSGPGNTSRFPILDDESADHSRREPCIQRRRRGRRESARNISDERCWPNRAERRIRSGTAAVSGKFLDGRRQSSALATTSHGSIEHRLPGRCVRAQDLGKHIVVTLGQSRQPVSASRDRQRASAAR